MNKQPVNYKQYDPRWADKPYRKEGGTGTIKGSGCGPACAAMLIESITGKTFTPEDACNWSMEHGYRTLNQGTEYAYFEPQFEAFGIKCEQLSWTNVYGKPDHELHAKAFQKLKEGYYLIAVMGPGTWTKSGHFVVVWWEDGKVRINDPASTAAARLNGDLATFKKQVKYYWVIDARKYNKNGKAVADTAAVQSLNEAPSGGCEQEVQTVKVELPILKKGSEGDSVKALQILLNGLGYNCGKADGDFGTKTDAAVRAFQKAMGLTVDGSVGAKTWAALLAV